MKLVTYFFHVLLGDWNRALLHKLNRFAIPKLKLIKDRTTAGMIEERHMDMIDIGKVVFHAAGEQESIGGELNTISWYVDLSNYAGEKQEAYRNGYDSKTNF